MEFKLENIDLKHLWRPQDMPTAELAVCLLPNAITLMSVDASRKLQFHEYFEHEPEQQAQAMSGLAERYDLAGKHCRWVLMPGQYQLIMADSLNVPLSEMAAAIKWNIKESLDYPMDNVALDIFSVPAYGAAKQNKKVFVVAADKNWLIEKVTMFEDAYVSLAVVDIADLAMRNIMAYYPNMERPLLLLHIYGSNGKLIIYWQQNIYLIRNLSFNVSSESHEEEFFNTVLLEVQRSFDYCQFELRLDAPQKIILTPNKEYDQLISDYMQQNLNLSVELIDLNTMLADSEKLSQDVQQKFFYTLGTIMNGWFTATGKEG